ncbi:MAG: enolase C-terminal domain-like protein [Burkholderiales bacterium]
MKLTIKNIRARAVMAPIKRPPVSASGAIPAAALVLIDIETSGGITGSSYIFAFQQRMLKATVAGVEAMAEIIQGDALAPYEIEARMRRSLTLLDSHGIIGQAIAGIDMAVWDVYAKALGVPLACALGGAVKPIRAYNSCGLWIQDPARVADEAAQLMQEGGFNAVKLRIGRPDFKQDLAAVRNVKKRIGNDACLMTDFNQSLSVSEALMRGRALDEEGLYWIEEPIRHDNYSGCAKIAAEVKTPVQIGENFLNTFEMQKAIEAGAAEYYMPDVQRIGGVTGWMRAAALAHANGLDMSSHLFPEFSAHLLAVTPTCHWLEYMDWGNSILREPFVIKEGQVLIPERLGAGIEWDEKAVQRYLVL